MSRLFAVNLLSREKEREGKCRFVMLSEIAVKPPSDRLVDTVLDLWETVGSAGVSARRISDASGIPVSSIYHYFGSLEQLFVVAQEVALAEARDWCHEQLRQLSDFPGQRSAFAGFFSQLVDGWAFEQRRLAFCWREGQLLAETGEGFRGVVRQWDTLWSRFWQEAGGMFTLARDTIVAQRIFETESLMHMLCWRRAVDRAGLDELGRGLGAWLTGAPMPDSPWRDFAREQAVRSVPSLPARDDVAAAIVAVAGDLIGAGGVAALTHRSVAEHAGVTLGVVLHRFKTKAHLVEAAFEAIYQSLVNGLQEYPPAADAPLPAVVLDEMAEIIGRGVGRIGNREIFLVAVRSPSLNQFGAQVRYLRGRKSQGTVQAIAGPGRDDGHLEAALFSSFASSQARAC
ncbi:MAG: TetR/AcrR family transcriptional regulator, partial [Novosphingobium sp.]